MTYLVRRYERGDIPKIVELVVNNIAVLPNYRDIKIEPSRIQFTLEHNETNDASIMLQLLIHIPTNEIVGLIAAYCNTSLISWDKIASDLFLLILPEHRTTLNATKLIRVYTEWARARKATMIFATQMSGYREDALSRFLVSLGFEQVGYIYRLTDGAKK